MLHRFKFRDGSPFFARGDIKYVILDLLKEKPKHGYEIIKDIEAKSAGFYSPSPGSVYPTLQMLEDLGYVRSTPQNGKRVYEITDAGCAFLAEKGEVVEEIRERVWHEHGYRVRERMQSIAHELRELAGTVAHSARSVRRDPERLRRVRDVAARAKREIAEILTEAPNEESS